MSKVTATAKANLGIWLYVGVLNLNEVGVS